MRLSDVKTDKLTIRKKRKRRNDHKIEKVEDYKLKDSTDGASIDAQQLHYSSREVRIRKGLRVGKEEDNLILLAFAWTDERKRVTLVLGG